MSHAVNVTHKCRRHMHIIAYNGLHLLEFFKEVRLIIPYVLHLLIHKETNQCSILNKKKQGKNTQVKFVPFFIRLWLLAA